ncbi:molybdopterin molybdotransferase MoeA [Leptothrix discophora]|uniref:Molybdopterin molybdenumtransferase n=1 Tax=Leptothrix discophora TaxID=89 RepID=A0ABT9G099_LEPDI|nr:gephyrin-like molybdotransferase Glp [Leptothrix discophora]MDP4299628.1 molybdopterin molybdotransferase MoeA [Leptothrix discophora]
MTAALGPSPLISGDAHLSVDQARATIANALQPIHGDEVVALHQALGRVLAEPVISPIDVPAHDNSAMDGYAFASTDLPGSGQVADLRVVATLHAGDMPTVPVPPGGCVRIMTGAVMPSGLDTVVPQELCQTVERDGQPWITLAAGVVQPGENRRLAGEDLARGKPAVPAGRRLRPAELGLIASLGIGQVTVRRRLKVAVFSTGNELRSLGEPLDPGCIYDSNRHTLIGALQRLGVEVVDLGLVRDDPAALEATLRRAVAEADAVLTSGGVSVGDADHTRALLAQLGRVDFWKVAMRPGRPFAFGPLAGGDGQPPRWLFALPGNPVASLVTFYAFVREALQQLGGAEVQPLPTLRVRCETPIRKRPGRTEFQRGIVARSADGGWSVRLTGAQGAGILRSMSEANALVVLGHEQASVASGEQVEVWLFDGLV